MRIGVFLSVSILAGSIWLSQGEAHAESSVPACIQVRTESRYVPFGYNHLVILKSGCSRAATCTVSTDVNPERITVGVAPGATVELLTFAGSPAQTFRATVVCRTK